MKIIIFLAVHDKQIPLFVALASPFPIRIFSIKRRALIKRRSRTPGQNCYFLNKRWGRLIGVPAFIWGRGKK